jgi:hypothetical protein
VKAGTIRQRTNAAASFNDTAVITAEAQDKQARTEVEEYDELDDGNEGEEEALV